VVLPIPLLMAEPVPDLLVLAGTIGVLVGYLWYSKPVKVLYGVPKLGRVQVEPYDNRGMT
jgi:hypothetical protein